MSAEDAVTGGAAGAGGTGAGGTANGTAGGGPDTVASRMVRRARGPLPGPTLEPLIPARFAAAPSGGGFGGRGLPSDMFNDPGDAADSAPSGDEFAGSAPPGDMFAGSAPSGSAPSGGVFAGGAASGSVLASGTAPGGVLAGGAAPGGPSADDALPAGPPRRGGLFDPVGRVGLVGPVGRGLLGDGHDTSPSGVSSTPEGGHHPPGGRRDSLLPGLGGGFAATGQGLSGDLASSGADAGRMQPAKWNHAQVAPLIPAAVVIGDHESGPPVVSGPQSWALPEQPGDRLPFAAQVTGTAPVTITVGHIDVRVERETPSPARGSPQPPPSRQKFTPRLTLAEFLADRDRGGSR